MPSDCQARPYSTPSIVRQRGPEYGPMDWPYAFDEQEARGGMSALQTKGGEKGERGVSCMI